MTTPSTSDGSSLPDGEGRAEAPFLPPARPVLPAPENPIEPGLAAPGATTDAPFLPSARPPQPAAAQAAPTALAFDAKAMVESQKHYNVNPAYGPMPAGSEESRAAARKLREEANRKRRRSRLAGRVVGVLVLAGVAVGAYFVWEAVRDDSEPVETDTDADTDAAPTGADGALTPLGEQELALDAMDDLNSGARPSAGALLDAVDDARDVVGQTEPPVGETPQVILVADVFTPAVLDHTEVLEPADGHERFVIRTADLIAINPSAHGALVERLLALPQVAAGDAQLAIAPVVPPGDIAIAIQRDDDAITRIVAVSDDPVIRTVGP